MDGATGSNLQKQGMPTGVCPRNGFSVTLKYSTELQREFLEAGRILSLPDLYSKPYQAERIRTGDRIRSNNQGLVEISKRGGGAIPQCFNKSQNLYIAADLTMTGYTGAACRKHAF
jgi:5-methyltetrahydrofolate--homocysteine methyltransferase